MRDRSFDFGYYNNVPDFIWKRPKTFDLERHQHYVNLEIFQRAINQKPSVKEPFALSRVEFDRRFPEVDESAGRAYWRIREMHAQLEQFSRELRRMEAKKGKERQDLQAKWLVMAGTLGHYVADLAQPLHVSENHDGQLTGQRGLHNFFEQDCVDELYPQISADVLSAAQKRWAQFKKENSKKMLPILMVELAEKSLANLKAVLEIDKKIGRRDLKRAANAHAKIIKESLIIGSLYLAEIYRRNLGWPFDGNRFYFFSGEPEFIVPARSETRGS